jgi:hypothetical protein
MPARKAGRWRASAKSLRPNVRFRPGANIRLKDRLAQSPGRLSKNRGFLNLYVLHRAPRLWDNPAAFDPDRFAPERSSGRHRFAFVPFGGGPRVCIGARFAMMEAKTFLATYVRAFTVAPASKVQPLPRFRLTTGPDGGMPLLIHARSAEHRRFSTRDCAEDLAERLS